MTAEFAVLESPQGSTYICRCKLFTSIFDAMDFMYGSVNIPDMQLLDLQTSDREVLEDTPHVFIN